MSYISNYFDEIDAEPETGSVLSHPDQNKTIYVYAWRETPLEYENVRRGDPVYMANHATSDETIADNGVVVSYYNRHELVHGDVTAIVGIALADAHYTGDNHKSDKPIPILVAGDVIATVPADQIKIRDDIAVRLRGHFYPGEYVSADGFVSTSEAWRLSDQLVLGQILAGKTRANRNENEDDDEDAIANRLHNRVGDNKKYYHIPIRLTVGPVLAAGMPNGGQSSVVTAKNDVVDEQDAGVALQANEIVVLEYHANSVPNWHIAEKGKNAGGFSSGIVLGTIEPEQNGEVLVTGKVTYKWEEAAAMIAKSNPTRLTPLVAKMKAAAVTNANEEPDFSSFYVGQRVTDTLHPILNGVPDNQFGTIDEIDPGLDGGTPTITVKMDPVSTDSPAYEADTVIDAGEDVENLPVGTSLIENPITHKMVPCRYDTDNVDATVIESVELPTINGWGIERYQKLYGNGVYQANGRFWKAIKKFGKGVYKKVIKPGLKWAISLAAPVAGTYVTALGNVIQSQTATACAQLLNNLTPITPPNGRYSYRTIHGKTAYTNDDEEIRQEYVDFGGSFRDTHQNVTQVWTVGSDRVKNDNWALGDCIRLDSYGEALKVTAYDQPITAVCNWLPVQDPQSNGWKIAGISNGRWEIRKSGLKVGERVMYDGTSAESRIAAGQRTCILGRVAEVWQPHETVIAAVKAGKLPKDEELPNCIVTVAPETIEATEPVSRNAYVDAWNPSVNDIPANTPVVLTHNPDYPRDGSNLVHRWKIVTADMENGDFANAITKDAAPAQDVSPVMVTGEVTYTWTDVARIQAAAAKKGLFNRRIAKAMAVAVTNEGEPDLQDYYIGMRVTDDLLPILDGVPGNQFGTITDIKGGLTVETPTITVKLDAVATNPPAYETSAIIMNPEESEDFPIGESLVENPITHKLWACRYNTDNIDATAVESVELPTINGWGLEQYQKLYGDGVYQANGAFWRAIKKFGKGIYKKVIRPAVKWGISLAAPVAGSYVSALGNVVQSQTATICGQLLNAVTPVNVNANGKYTYRTIHGRNAESDEEIEQANVNCSGSFADTHRNVQEIYEFTGGLSQYAIGDCITTRNRTVELQKVTDYETPIEAIVNWPPSTASGIMRDEDLPDNAVPPKYVTGITKGYWEYHSTFTPQIGTRVMYDCTSAEDRIAAGQPTAVLGRVVEVWQEVSHPQPWGAQQTPENSGCLVIIEVDPYFDAGTVTPEPITKTRLYRDVEWDSARN